LVLVPDSYSRNRFYELYNWPAARRARRRAALLRSVVADLLRGVEDLHAAVTAGRATIGYSLPQLGVRRLTLVDLDELVLVLHMIGQAQRASPRGAIRRQLVAAEQSLGAVAGPGARERLDALLGRLYHGCPSGRPSGGMADDQGSA